MPESGPTDGEKRIEQTSDGLIEDSAAQGMREWTRKFGAAETDTRSLAELAAIVQNASQEDVAAEALGATSEPESGAEVHAAQAEPDEAEEERPWRTVIVALGAFAVFGALLGYALFGGGAGPNSPGAGDGAAAAPPAGQPPAEAAAPSAPETQPAAVVVAPTQPPAPAPRPAATPAPTAPPAPPVVLHVADLDWRTRKVGGKVKVSVEILVHDAAHNPVAGATVSGVWTGASGATSCVTGAAGSCVVDTSPVAASAGVTFTVGGISAAGAAYGPALNHDPDGDSSGTSVTAR